MTTLYMDTPDGIPGNDDLGTMSAWYVWTAMGLYPQFPAVRDLDIGAPLFPRIVIHAPNGPTITIDAPAASATMPYVTGVRVNGAATQHTWFALPLRGTVHLAFDLASTPNKSWGAADGDAMPAFAPNSATFPPSTAVRIDVPHDTVQLDPGASNGAIDATFRNTGRAAATVTWSIPEQSGFTVAPSAGVLHLAPNGAQTVALTVAAAASGLYNVHVTAVDDNGAHVEPAIANVRAAHSGEQLLLAWIANRFNDTVMPYDPRTGALGTPIAVKDEPRDGVLSLDGHLYFVADRGAKTISVIDTVQSKVVAEIAVGSSPNGIAIAPDGATVWVANYDDGTIQPIDVRTLKAGKALDVGTNPRYIAIARDGTRLYVTTQGSNAIAVVDANARTLLAPIAVGERPTGIALSPDGRKVYVVDNGGNDLSIIDLATNRAIARVPVGVEPMYVCVNPSGTLAYVTNYASTTLTPIDLQTNTAEPNLTVGGQPFDVEWLHDGSAALVILHRGNALVRINRDGSVAPPLFLGSGGAYTIAVPH
jgi:YVTN family beta-propeller protein